MGRFFAGILVGAALAISIGWLWSRSHGDRVCAPAAAPSVSQPPPKEKHRRARRDSPAAADVHLKPGDDKMIAEGDALGRPQKIDLSEPDARELSQEDLDDVFHRAGPRIERCITDALGDAPLETGRVEVGLRVEKSGQVGRVRVEAPALLQHNGLTRCIRDAVASLIFPASGAASVVTYPFELK
jgi:hypothetical protein